MFKLPVCPHCGTVYRYKDVIGAVRESSISGKDKRIICYHCDKPFQIKVFPGILILLAVWVALNIGTNLLLLSRMTSLNLIVLLGVTLFYMALAVLLVPFFLSFRKCEKKKK